MLVFFLFFVFLPFEEAKAVMKLNWENSYLNACLVKGTELRVKLDQDQDQVVVAVILYTRQHTGIVS